MNKFKIVSLVLAIALLGTLGRLVLLMQSEAKTEPAGKAETVYRNILSRKSVRSFEETPVSAEQVDTLLRAAMAAPTGRDMRPWRFVVIDNRVVMDSLVEQLPYAKMLKEAPLAIVVCGDQSVLGRDGKPSCNWSFDCSAATENLLLMAEAMGLGAVWTGVYPYEDRMAAVSKALHLPDYIIPLNLIPIGYPKGNPQPKEKYDATNVHYNGW